MKQNFQKKLNFIHPFNDYKIIEGQATLFLEILDQTDEKIDTLIIPIVVGITIEEEYLKFS